MHGIELGLGLPLARYNKYEYKGEDEFTIPRWSLVVPVMASKNWSAQAKT